MEVRPFSLSLPPDRNVPSREVPPLSEICDQKGLVRLLKLAKPLELRLPLSAQR